jgi:ketosteroid isomerase-like protein
VIEQATALTASEMVTAYYEAWTRGTFDEDRLRSILAEDLVFEGPLAGRRVGADAFLRGVRDVSNALKDFRLIQRLENEDEVSVLYDGDLTRPAGTHRFAEFFSIRDGRIRAINLLYDGTEWRKLAAS